MGWTDQLHNLLMPIRWPLTVGYLVTLALISVYGLHRYWITLLFYRTRSRVPRPAGRYDRLPRVTVQLPMYNERHVAERVIEAACGIRYPADRLQVEVLDDSTDESAEIARRCCERLAGRGHDVQYIHRADRVGYKAGALEHGLKTATGEFIAVFDADFVPPPAFLRRTIHHFTDPQVGMVQTCWDHLNRDASALTASQAVFLDGHFLIEHTARNRAGRWMNFNGTAGIWRRATIESAGGWQHDTLTEDVDLSYRAQLAGWRFVYLPRVRCPAELPPEIEAFKSQQHRWTKGSIQTARKLLWKIFRSSAPLGTKIEAFFHLTSPMVYVLMVLMVLIIFPALFVNVQPFERGDATGWVFCATVFLLATASAGSFYVAGQRQRRRGRLSAIAQIPMLLVVGIGITLNNTRAVLEALVGHRSGFIRTPKYRATGRDAKWRQGAALVRLPARRVFAVVEILVASYLTLCLALAMSSAFTAVSMPFIFLFAAGYWYVGLASLTGAGSGVGARPVPA
jgi:cellulose synthase/poly-beta-1,6-N-acetylglucosamine synthase-like glycosyltransferase